MAVVLLGEREHQGVTDRHRYRQGLKRLLFPARGGEHQRGLWRRTTLSSYLAEHTDWEILLDIDALERCLRDGHLAGAGLDVVPEEPPREPLPGLLRAYHAREDWTIGRVVVTPHIAFHTPEAWDDIRLKSAETMRDVLVEGLRTNVIPPEAD